MSAVFATAYTFPGNATAPLSLSTGDTFTISGALFQSTGTEISAFGSIEVPSSSSGNTITITGGTISATGTSTGGVATLPIFGASSSATTLTVAGGAIINNLTQLSTEAINFSGPLEMTMNSGAAATITGSVTGGDSSSLIKTLGTIDGAVTFGEGSTVSVGNANITGLLTVGNDSTINLSGSGTLTAGITATGSTLNFGSGTFTPPTATGIKTLNVNINNPKTLTGGSAYTLADELNITSGSLTIGSTLSAGTATTTNAGTLALSVADALPAGDIINSGTITFGASQIFSYNTTNSGTMTITGSTLTNNDTFTTSGSLTGGSVINNASMIYTGGAVTSNVTNNLDFSVTNTFSTGGTFTNASSGSIFIYGSNNARVNNPISAGTKIYFGQDADGVTSSANFTTGNTIAGVPIITVFSGSSLTVNHTISTMSNLFTVEPDATLTLTQTLTGSGAGSFVNNGTTVINIASAVNVPGAFVNTNVFDIGSGSWITATYSSINNTGVIYLPSTGTLTIGADVSIGGTLSIGMNSTGAISTKAQTIAFETTLDSINLYSTSTLTASGGASNPIRGNMYLLGTQTDPFAGTFIGSRLTIGVDSFGAAYNPTVTFSGGTVSGYSSLYVSDGILMTSGAGAISNLNTGLFIASGATFTAGAAVSGNSINGNNSGTLNLGAAFSITRFINSTGGVINMTGGTISSTSTLINNSTGNGSVAGINITSASVVNGTINNYGSMNFQSQLTGTGTINNGNAGTIEFDTGTNNAVAINNLSGGTINASVNFTNTATIENYGEINFSNNIISGAGTLNNQSGGTLNLNSAYNVAHTITNNSGGILNILGVSTTDVAISNLGTMNYTGELTGGGSISNGSGGTINMIAGTNGVPITNALGATLAVSGSSTSESTITNTGTMTITDVLAGSDPTYTVTNTGTGTLTISNATVDNNISNAAGATLTLTDLNQFSGTFTNGASTLNWEGTTTMTGTSFINSNNASGIVNITGITQLNSDAATSYVNVGTHNASIISTEDYGQLVSNQGVDLTGCTLVITPYITNTNGQVESFNMVEGTTITGPASISIPSTDFYRVINVEQTTTNIIVQINAEQVTVPINVEIADVLQTMFANTTNSGQQSLEDAFLSINRNLNSSLHQMIPISNAFVYDNKMQGVVFNKVDARLAGLRDGWDNSVHRGIMAGDLMPGSSFWISGSGSLTEQGPDDEDDGYNAKTGVVLLGRDFQFCNNIVGIAAGYSYTHLKELSNQNFINNTSRWHGLVYGSYEFRGLNYWDWLFTTSFNNNHSHREINVAGNNLTTRADYHAYQLAARVVRGKGFNFLDSYRFTPYTLLQYSFVHQDAYSEQGSVAALSINEVNKSVATIGAGCRFNFPLDAWGCIGMRELRATVVYDIVNNNNDTTANFIVGSDSFTVTSTPVRLGLQLGAGIAFQMSRHLVFELDYDFEVRSRFTDNTGLVKIKFVF